MADNNSGGGLFLWATDLISDHINNKRIRKYNKQSRGLEEYQSMSPDLIFPTESYRESILISGGSSIERLQLENQIIKNCSAQKQAMIILHLSNNELERLVVGSNYGFVLNQSNKYFDAFTSFELQEICQVFLDTCKAKYDIKPAGRYVLQIICELLACRNVRPYFANLASCPIYELSDRINDRLLGGQITQDEANKLNSLLLMGQTESAKIDTFIYDMKAQIDYISASNPNSTGAYSVLSAIKKGEILCIDLKSSTNILFVELIVNSLIIAMNRGYEFSLFLDDIAVANNELLKNALCQKSNHNNIICSKDFYSLLGGKDDIFSTIAGEADKTVLFSHGSHMSCEKWAKFLGEYDKIDVSHNTNGGWSQSSKWGYNTNQGQTMTDKREYKIKPEQINRLTQKEIIIYDNQTGSLIQTGIV